MRPKIIGQDEDQGGRCAWCDRRSLRSPCKECVREMWLDWYGSETAADSERSDIRTDAQVGVDRSEPHVDGMGDAQ